MTKHNILIVMVFNQWLLMLLVHGIPQGTVLGPLLFLIYINDFPECVSSSYGLFANDCLLYNRIECLDDCHADPSG